MSSMVPLAYVDVRVLTHATEDIDKVEKAVHNVLPAQVAERVIFKKTVLKGHYGNPIVFLETRIENGSAVEAVFEKLAAGLSSLDKQALKDEIDRRLEKGDFFVRLDKQSAYLNEIRLQSEDPIRLRIHFRRSSREEILEFSSRFGVFL